MPWYKTSKGTYPVSSNVLTLSEPFVQYLDITKFQQEQSCRKRHKYALKEHIHISVDNNKRDTVVTVHESISANKISKHAAGLASADTTEAYRNRNRSLAYSPAENVSRRSR